MAGVHLFRPATAPLDIVLVDGMVICGTVAWAIQARLVCPHCGKRYGYRFRVLNSHLCLKCNGDMRVG